MCESARINFEAFYKLVKEGASVEQNSASTGNAHVILIQTLKNKRSVDVPAVTVIPAGNVRYVYKRSSDTTISQMFH